jgi:hypothetical protein
MTDSYNWDVTVGVKANVKPFRETMEELKGGYLDKPFEVQIKGGTGKTEALVGSTSRFYNEIKKASDVVETLQINYVRFKDVVSGKEVRVAAEQIKVLSGATGELFREVTSLNQAELAKMAADTNYKRIGRDKVMLKEGEAVREAAKQYTEMGKEVTKTGELASAFLAKSQNMSGKQAEAAKGMAQAIKLEEAEFAKFMKAGNWDKVKESAVKVSGLKQEFLELEAATKRPATAISNWADSLRRAFTQTVAYSFSLGLIREAQALLNDAVRYSIDLNTEMTKIRVLQTEGAKTTEEINALAQSYTSWVKLWERPL